jgi:deoxyribonuclease-4
MASPDKTAWKRSVDLQRIELERCETLRIPLCVAHPGAHLGETIPPGPREGSPESPSADEAGGLDRIVRALDRIHADLPGYRTITCLETTVGSGTNLGYDFRHLAWIRDRVAAPERVAFCFDTCHVTAAGYDMSTPKGAKATMRAFDDSCGLEGIRAFHVNDSEGNIGSRRDRHAHIGDGTCGRSCFQAILAPRFDRVPRILETGKESTPKGTPMDTVNITRLKRLARESTRSR